jgi:hypothetical protein
MPDKHSDNYFDQAVRSLVDDMHRTVESIGQGQKPQPFGTVKLNQQEQMDAYLQMRDDPQAWADILSKEGIRAFLEYASVMEGRLQAQGGEHGGTQTENQDTQGAE